MKKSVLTLMILTGALGAAYSQTVPIHSLWSQAFSEDPTPTRFSPANLADGDPGTVFAAPLARVESVKPLLTINFSEPTKVEGVRLKAGWFDEKQFRVFHRAKTVRVWVKLSSGALVPAQNFPLKDQMVPQDLVLTKPAEVVQLFLSVPEVYPGSRTKDLVLSAVEILSAGQALVPSLATAGSRVKPLVTSEFVFRGGRLTKETRQTDEGTVVATPVYDAEGNQILTRTLSEAPSLTTTSVVLLDASGHPSHEVVLDGQAQTQGTWSFTYEADLLVKKTWSGPREPRTVVYSYQEGRVVREETTWAGSGRKLILQRVWAGGYVVFEKETWSEGDSTAEVQYQLGTPGSATQWRLPITVRSVPADFAEPTVTLSTYEESRLVHRLVSRLEP